MPKPTAIQQTLASIVRSNASDWITTNDISSPTHWCDMDESMRMALLDDSITEEQAHRLNQLLTELLCFIREQG